LTDRVQAGIHEHRKNITTRQGQQKKGYHEHVVYPGDILIVDRSLETVDKKIVIAVLDGELTVKRLRIRSGIPSLEPENDRYTPIVIKPDMAFEIWGVVTNVTQKV
jgi:DNA polymerase V